MLCKVSYLCSYALHRLQDTTNGNLIQCRCSTNVPVWKTIANQKKTALLSRFLESSFFYLAAYVTVRSLFEIRAIYRYCLLGFSDVAEVSRKWNSFSF